MNKNEKLKLIMTQKGEKTEIFFENDLENIPLNTLTDFLRYFKALYAYLEKRPELLEEFEGQTLETIMGHKTKIEKTIQKHFNDLDTPSKYLSPNYNRDLEGNDIFIEEIRKTSPLTITIASVGVILVAAIIISGGEMDFLRMRFKVNALGDGLGKLKKLFHTPTRRNR